MCAVPLTQEVMQHSIPHKNYSGYTESPFKKLPEARKMQKAVRIVTSPWKG